MIYLSATSIKDFVECSQRYKYRVEQPEEAISTPEMKAGLIVHSILEKYWDQSKESNLKTALHLAEKEGLDDNLISKIMYCVGSYHANFSHLLTKDDKIELSFKIKLETGVYLVGRIDRIVEGSNLVLDWKTSRNPPENIDNDIQFMIYYFAYTKLYNRPPSLVSYVSLMENKLISLHKERSNYDYLVSDIIPGMIKQIKNNNYYRSGIFTYKCKNCQFRGVCLGK